MSGAMFRLILLALTAAAGGLALGRKAIDRGVAQRVAAEIELARARAMAALDEEVQRMIRTRLFVFGSSLAIKAGLVGAAYLLFASGHLTATGLHIVSLVLIAGFLGRDAARTLPYVMPAYRLARTHRWNPKRMLTELVAGVVFERAYAEALLASQTGANRYWIALSNYSANSLSNEVAEAVAEVARTTSYERIRPRIIYGAATAAAMMTVYSLLVFAILQAG